MHGIGEEHLVEHRVAGDVADRPALDAGRVHVDDERGDALVLRAPLERGRVGAQQEQAPLARGARRRSTSSGRSRRSRRRRGSPMRAHVREVGAGLGLAEALAPVLVRRAGCPAASGPAARACPTAGSSGRSARCRWVVDARARAPAPSPPRRWRSAPASPRARATPCGQLMAAQRPSSSRRCQSWRRAWVRSKPSTCRPDRRRSSTSRRGTGELDVEPARAARRGTPRLRP